MNASDPLIQEARYYHQTGAHEKAEAAYKRVLKKFPANVNALFYLSLLHGQTGAYARAAFGLEAYVRACPQSAEGFYNLALAYQNLERYDDALKAYEAALGLNQNLLGAINNRGTLLRRRGDIEQARTCFLKTIALQPTNADALHNLSLLELSVGEFERGWKNYEWRKKTETPVGNKQFEKPSASSLDEAIGKRILIHWEQGLGDTIQFCRYVPMLLERGIEVFFQPQERLKTLMSTLHPAPTLVDEAPADFDLHAPLLSLPMLFGTELDNIPAKTPYLAAQPERIAQWAERIGTTGFKIGICWKGSSAYKNDKIRSFPAAHFETLSKLDSVRLISLHKGEGEADIAALTDRFSIETLGPDFDSGPDAFLDTAACMTCLDLVITSDTSIAHLAGALNVPVWVALNTVPDFRWMLERDDCPWYPTMRLFRQNEPGDWPSVFAAMATALQNEVKTGS